MMSQLEIRRRLFHLINGFLFVGLIYYDIVTWFVAFLLFLGTLVLGLVVKKWKFPFLFWFFKTFDRPKDFEKLPGKGSVYYMAGITLSLYLFPKDVAIASILILAIGDSMAAIIGQYGDIQNPFNPRKYIEGSIGGAILAGLAAALFVAPLEAFLAAIIAMAAEGVDWRLGVNQLDDNIIMPLVAGLVIMFLRFI